MAKCFCPLSDVAVQHIRSLSESYRLLVAAANDYNGIALADRKQIERAICRADQIGDIIEGYIHSWRCGSPCLVFSCGWEYCRRNLETLNAVNNIPRPTVVVREPAAVPDNNQETVDIAPSHKQEGDTPPAVHKRQDPDPEN